MLGAGTARSLRANTPCQRWAGAQSVLRRWRAKTGYGTPASPHPDRQRCAPWRKADRLEAARRLPHEAEANGSATAGLQVAALGLRAASGGGGGGAHVREGGPSAGRACVSAAAWRGRRSAPTRFPHSPRLGGDQRTHAQGVPPPVHAVGVGGSARWPCRGLSWPKETPRAAEADHASACRGLASGGFADVLPAAHRRGRRRARCRGPCGQRPQGPWMLRAAGVVGSRQGLQRASLEPPRRSARTRRLPGHATPRRAPPLPSPLHGPTAAASSLSGPDTAQAHRHACVKSRVWPPLGGGVGSVIARAVDWKARPAESLRAGGVGGRHVLGRVWCGECTLAPHAWSQERKGRRRRACGCGP